VTGTWLRDAVLLASDGEGDTYTSSYWRVAYLCYAARPGWNSLRTLM